MDTRMIRDAWMPYIELNNCRRKGHTTIPSGNNTSMNEAHSHGQPQRVAQHLPIARIGIDM
eukprot:scaffold119463_cov18-Prasinocladus_malaysianus.AAC.1